MKLLKYKGILFDEWTEEKDDDGNDYYWAEMCDKHAAEYEDILTNELSDDGTGGCCSVFGCDRTGESEDDIESWYYVDFDADQVEFIEIEDDEEIEYIEIEHPLLLKQTATLEDAIITCKKYKSLYTEEFISHCIEFIATLYGLGYSKVDKLVYDKE